MRRPAIHRAFFAVTASLLTLCLWQGWTLFEYQRLIAAVNAVPETLTAETGEGEAPSPPEALLARASALSKGEQFEAAEALFVKLIDQHGDQPLGLAARFNLANHYLRQGIANNLSQGTVLPLLGMAKQRYRDLLRASPFDWEARYNLEQALALAPEGDDEDGVEKQYNQRANVVVPDFEQLQLP